MRFHLKRTLQVTFVLLVCVIYLGFFFSNSTSLYYRSSFSPQISVYPSEDNYEDDRILAQLEFVPRSILESHKDTNVVHKKILVHSGLSGWKLNPGQATFLDQKCPVNQCELLDYSSDITSADIVLFQTSAFDSLIKSPGQIWILFLLESPVYTDSYDFARDKINWTATYRHDSTIVAPYEKFALYNASILTKPQNRNYAEGKTKKVAWFVSNCQAINDRRGYVRELEKYIKVDIYGACGKFDCPRNDARCFKILNEDYKFYLSFENSNCRDYITEKFYVNGLKHDVIPIVMGAPIEDYERAAPFHSFIHVDQFDSPSQLADYLHKLDKDDNLYNEYFQWKGTGRLINTFFWCRLCALAHDTDRGPSWYTDIGHWWKDENTCIGRERWKTTISKKKIADLPIVHPLNP